MPEDDAPSPPRPGRLTQDPHRLRERREKVLEVAIGRELRALRRARGLTASELAAEAGLSAGMLSKIENGQISPSLGTLATLAHVLSVPMTAFFRGHEAERTAVHVKAGSGLDVERRGTRAGHQYSLLGHIGANASGVTVEPYLITLTAASDVFPTFQHEGVEFIHMLEGVVEYRHGDGFYRLEPGDSLFFEADAPHGPERLVTLPARYLSVICYPQRP
jgi:transcriptional regulator with XRE-family HTH domain